MILPLASRVLRNNGRFLHARERDLSRAIKRSFLGCRDRFEGSSEHTCLESNYVGPGRRRNIQREKFHPLPASSAVIDSFAFGFTHVAAVHALLRLFRSIPTEERRLPVVLSIGGDSLSRLSAS